MQPIFGSNFVADLALHILALVRLSSDCIIGIARMQTLLKAHFLNSVIHS